MRDCYFCKYEPIFGAWRIIEEIGAGSEGHLYRIKREDALGHVFYSALKAITIPSSGEAELDSLITGGMSHEDAEKYFYSILDNTSHEFELLEKLKGNSNIVSYEDHEIFRREEGFGWDILIRLEELTPFVKHSIHHKMEEPEIIRMASDICSGLVLCRKYGIVHRDIKPENIFVSQSGSFKLGDFGIARIIEVTDTVLSRKGTYTYMAPEVYWGKDYDYSVDVYSLGMVMYKYMNDGRMPFMPEYPDPIEYQDGEKAFFKRVNGAELPEPRNGSPELKRIILKACAFDRTVRYSSAEEMLKDLERLEHGQTIAGGNTINSGKIPRWLKIAASVLLISVLLVIATYTSIPKEVTDIEGVNEGTEIYIGDDLTPEYTVVPDWFKDEPVSFASDDEKVFTVDSDGTLHAVSVGEATLTVSAKEYSEQVLIKIVPKVTEIGGIEKTISMTTGDTLTLKPELSPEKFASEPVKYKIKDKAVAAVSKKGVITAVSAGETVLTVSAGGTSFKAEIIVSDPVIYVAPRSTTGTTKTKKKSSEASKGYFDSSDDEQF